jgi:hypothetical protein
MQNRDVQGREAFRSDDARQAIISLAQSFMGLLVMSRPESDIILLIGCQDAREFLQRNRDLLA